MSFTRARELQQVLAESNRIAAPTEADRARLTATLRARLGAAVVPEGLAPEARAPRPPETAPGSAWGARATLGRSSWHGVVASTAVVAGALGFALGYGMSQRAGAAATERNTAPVQAVAAAPPPVAPALPLAIPAAPPSAGASPPAPATLPPAQAGPARRSKPARESLRPAPGAARRAAASPQGPSFAEVLERLRRAQLALEQGQASLALIQLASLDRGAGDVLREEREVTRVLALCAAGDVAGARRVAEPLRREIGSSLYAPRLDASCARAGEP